MIRRVGFIALVCGPMLGTATGSLYSHGFDIPWWSFGLFGSACMLLAAVLALVVSRLLGLEKHNKPLQPIARGNARSG